MRYGKPLTRTREYIQIVRQILKREKPAELHGEDYELPYTGPGATGLGKPLKSILHGRADLPIYTAAISPAGVKAAAEVADGFFPIWMTPEKWSVFAPHVEEGFKTGGRRQESRELRRRAVRHLHRRRRPREVPQGGEADAGALHRRHGRARRNFYNDYAKRLGYEEAAVRIQDAFLAGNRGEAMAAVPDKLVDEVALVGPEGADPRPHRRLEGVAGRDDVPGHGSDRGGPHGRGARAVASAPSVGILGRA